MTLILQTLFGSHLYGTETADSDQDWKAVRIPTAREILLQRVRATITDNSKSDASVKNASGDIDRETWALHQFLKLVAEGQTVAMDVLFSTSRTWAAFPHPIWHEIVANRPRLLSRKASAFLGYCRNQAAKYGIKGSRMAAARAARDLFARTLETMDRRNTVGELFRAGHLGNLLTMEHIHLEDRTMPNGDPIQHLSVCNRLVPFTAQAAAAHDIFSRLFERYGERARAAERNEGIDWKAISHAVRVGRQAIELLNTGHITFPRPEADHLRRIKQGRLPYALVAEEVERLLEVVEKAAETSTLPQEPDREFMEKLVLRAYGAEVCGW